MSTTRFAPYRRGLIALAVTLGTLAAPRAAVAQAEPQVTDSLEQELSRLRSRVDSLGQLVEGLRQQEDTADEAEDPLARLRAAAAEAAGEAEDRAAGEEEEEEETQEFVGRQRSLQALNPEISINADVFGRLNTDDVGENNFIPREAEFSFQASLDPFSRAKFFVAHHQPGGEIEPFEGLPGAHAHGGGEEEEGGSFAIEEGYVEWVGLPGGLSAKLGKFFQRFGTLNRWHNHALWFQSRSLPHLAFVGEEALAQTGASLHWLIPVDLRGTYETWFQVTRSENGRLFGESNEPSYLGHVNAFWQLNESLDLDLGVSGLFGEHSEELESFGQRLYNVEGTLTWRPPGRTLYREFVLRGGAMLLDPDVPPPASPGEESEFADDAWGGWAWANFKFARQWWIGGRFEWTQNPTADGESAWLAGPTLTWWQSEWVRLRAEYDFLQRDGTRALSQFLLQVTFAMGPHKHETY